MQRNPFIADGKFLKHPCSHDGCNRDGSFGIGCDFRQLSKALAECDPNATRYAGKWWCAEHVPPDFWAGKVKAQAENQPGTASTSARSAVPVQRTQFKNGQGVLL